MAMTRDDRNTLNYETPLPTRRPPGSLRRRILYCISLPLIVLGLAMSQSPGDRETAAVIAAFGALLLGFALPLGGNGDGR